MRHLLRILLPAMLAMHTCVPVVAASASWSADNGNGTYTNPLFYDEFSDPDLIRVGDWSYMPGTTMHAVPGLPLLRSRDLVNWVFCSYAAPSVLGASECRLG